MTDRAELDRTLGQVAVLPRWLSAPLWFRFTDRNPFSGEAYLASRWDDLPYAVAVLVNQLWGLRSREWEHLVSSGEIVNVVGMREYPLPFTLDLPVPERRNGRAPVDACPNCWGTGVDSDSDGSISGTVDASVMCTCVQAALQRTTYTWLSA